jgi:hypothetical protein
MIDHGLLLQACQHAALLLHASLALQNCFLLNQQQPKRKQHTKHTNGNAT